MQSYPDELSREVLDALAITRGHFVYESGLHGEIWLDLNAVFVDAARTREWAARIASSTRASKVEVVCGPLVGGALLAQLVAQELGARFVFAEATTADEGDVRYRIPQSLRAVVAGRRVLLVDDAVNAGYAWTSTLGDLRECRAELAGCATLLTLGRAAARIAGELGVPLLALASLEQELWAPETCPACRKHIPLSYELIRS